MSKSRSMSMDGNVSIASEEQTSKRTKDLAHKVVHKATRKFFSRAKGKVKALSNIFLPSFSRFPDLPSEVRDMIWKATIEPRVHELHPCPHHHRKMTFRSNNAATPVIFFVNQESRAEAMRHHKIMEYIPPNVAPHELRPGNGKGILPFYFAPKYDTLFLNSLMGLFTMFMLLEGENEDPEGRNLLNIGGQTDGVYKGWETVAIDAERAKLIIIFAGAPGHTTRPKFMRLLPDLKELILAIDCDKKGASRFRSSVWPRENGTTIENFCDYARLPFMSPEVDRGMGGLSVSIRRYLKLEYQDADEADDDNRSAADLTSADREAGILFKCIPGNGIVPTLHLAMVHRKIHVRGEVRYALRTACYRLHIQPRGVFQRI